MKMSDTLRQPLVSIVTVNYNQTELTLALLESIRRQDYAPVQVIVVDNGSRENPTQIIQTRFPDTICIRSEQNLGFAGGNNLALPAAKGDYLFFVNNDAEITPGCIATLAQHFKAFPQTGIVSPLLCYFGHNPELIQYAGMTSVNPLTARNRTIGEREPNAQQYTQSAPTAYAHGAAMMVPRAVLDTVGPMDSGFFLYYEELDWCARIRRKGFEIWVAPLAKVYHKESATVQELGALKTYYLTRNRLRFMRRNFSALPLSFFFLFLWLVTVPKNTFLYLWRRQTDNLRAFWLGILWNFGLKKNEFERTT